MEKFLITGGQGCIGTWIARQLIGEGVACTLVDLEPNEFILQQLFDADTIASIDRVYGDISDPTFTQDLVSKTDATRIIHLAGLQIPVCRANPVLGAQVNVVGTINMFEAARLSEGQVKSVTYASSAGIIGPPQDYDGPIGDDTPHRPRTHYGYFKLANEGNARIYWQDHGIPSVGLRPYVVYGIGREHGFSSGPSRAVRAAVAGKPFTIAFSGRCGYNLVRDVAAQFIACARNVSEEAWGVNLPGVVVDMPEVVAFIEAAIPEAAGSIAIDGEPLPVAYEIEKTNLGRLAPEAPDTPLAEGIKETADLYRDLYARGVLDPEKATD